MQDRCSCFIVPKAVLELLSQDLSLPEETRRALADTGATEATWRKLRTANVEATKAKMAIRGIGAALATSPVVTVFDCHHTTSLPGTPVANPAGSTDITARRTFDTTTQVAAFYQSVFGRNSLDGAGKTLVSSIHYDVRYNNAFWDGTQMTYGDGDGHIFVDFTASNDVVAHELTHGVTQFSLALSYTNEAGGLNESLSDVFGVMFRQWMNREVDTKLDWRIGVDIMGPAAQARGYTCLRDMANPGGKHCLAPQPFNIGGYFPGIDPHQSSGIPNHAFYLAANTLGGNAWDILGKVWYAAMTGRSSPNMKFRTFANRTRRAARTLYPANPSVFAAVNSGWAGVGL